MPTIEKPSMQKVRLGKLLMMVRLKSLKFTFAFSDLFISSFAFATILSLKRIGIRMAAAMMRRKMIAITIRIFFMEILYEW
jgi:hypothetical protein